VPEDPASAQSPSSDGRPAGESSPGGAPVGGPYDWYRRGLALLESGDADAASLLLGRAFEADPGSRSVAEALGRAHFGTRRFTESAELFSGLIERDPADDYAQFGLGLALTRLGRHEEAVTHLTLAAVMRPGRDSYDTALRQARATVDARRQRAS
jgi:tetratricopeptide (TPR) repeat protein